MRLTSIWMTHTLTMTIKYPLRIRSYGTIYKSLRRITCLKWICCRKVSRHSKIWRKRVEKLLQHVEQRSMTSIKTYWCYGIRTLRATTALHSTKTCLILAISAMVVLQLTRVILELVVGEPAVNLRQISQRVQVWLSAKVILLIMKVALVLFRWQQVALVALDVVVKLFSNLLSIAIFKGLERRVKRLKASIPLSIN